LVDRRAVVTSSANKLETQRDANGSASPAAGLSARPEQQEQADKALLWGLASQHIELVSEDKDFSLQSSP